MRTLKTFKRSSSTLVGYQDIFDGFNLIFNLDRLSDNVLLDFLLHLMIAIIVRLTVLSASGDMKVFI